MIERMGGGGNEDREFEGEGFWRSQWVHLHSLYVNYNYFLFSIIFIFFSPIL